MTKRLSTVILAVVVLPCLLTGAMQAQANASCKVQYQYFCGDKLIPGASCSTEGPCLAVCTVGTYQCNAICWDCLFGTPIGGGPINLANGNTFITQTDLTIPGLGGGLNLTRSWHSQFPFGEYVSAAGMFGANWRSTYEESISVDSDGLAIYVRGTGGIWTLGLTGPSWPLNYIMIAPANGNLTLSYDGNLWTLTFLSGEKRTFSAATGQLLSMIDRNGNTTSMTYDALNRLVTVTDPASRHLYFTYAGPASTLVTGVSSDAGVSLSYAYDNQGRLTTVTKPDSTTVSFQYDNNSMITAVLDNQGKVLESHTYDGLRRGLTSSRANGVDSMTITYPPIEGGWLPY